MDQTPSHKWTAVDNYFSSAFLVADDDHLTQTLYANAAAGLPAHDVSPLQGKFLHLLATLCHARRVLEIGTLGGYSTIWLARAVLSNFPSLVRAVTGAPPEMADRDSGKGTGNGNAKVVSLEINPTHVRVARENITRAGLSNVVDVRMGPALRLLEEMIAKMEDEGGEMFDFVFIDADKKSNVEYFERALRLTQRGAIIVVDNVVRGGEVVDRESNDESVKGVRALVDYLRLERRVDATALQTVGIKGWDGFIVALVTGAHVGSD